MSSFKKATHLKYAAYSKIKLKKKQKNITNTDSRLSCLALSVMLSSRQRISCCSVLFLASAVSFTLTGTYQDFKMTSWRPGGCSEVVSSASLGQLKCDTTIWAAALSLQCETSTSQFYNILSAAEHWYQPATFTKTYSICILASTCTHTTDKHISVMVTKGIVQLVWKYTFLLKGFDEKVNTTLTG